jgi:hypothetical protein
MELTEKERKYLKGQLWWLTPLGTVLLLTIMLIPISILAYMIAPCLRPFSEPWELPFSLASSAALYILLIITSLKPRKLMYRVIDHALKDGETRS